MKLCSDDLMFSRLLEKGAEGDMGSLLRALTMTHPPTSYWDKSYHYHFEGPKARKFVEECIMFLYENSVKGKYPALCRHKRAQNLAQLESNVQE